MDTFSSSAYPHQNQQIASRDTQRLFSSLNPGSLQPSLLESKNTYNYQNQGLFASAKNQSSINNVSVSSGFKDRSNGLRMTTPKLGYAAYGSAVNDIVSDDGSVREQPVFSNNYIMVQQRHLQMAQASTLQCWLTIPILIVLSCIVIYSISSHMKDPLSQNTLKYYSTHPDKVSNPELREALGLYNTPTTDQHPQTDSANQRKSRSVFNRIEDDTDNVKQCKQGEFLVNNKCVSCPAGSEWTGQGCEKKETSNENFWNRDILSFLHGEVLE